MSTATIPPAPAITGTVNRQFRGYSIFDAQPGYRRLKAVIALDCSSHCFFRHPHLTAAFKAFARRWTHSSWSRR